MSENYEEYIQSKQIEIKQNMNNSWSTPLTTTQIMNDKEYLQYLNKAEEDKIYYLRNCLIQIKGAGIINQSEFESFMSNLNLMAAKQGIFFASHPLHDKDKKKDAGDELLWSREKVNHYTKKYEKKSLFQKILSALRCDE